MAIQPLYRQFGLPAFIVAIAATGCATSDETPPEVIVPAGGELPAAAVRQVEFEQPILLRGGRYSLIPVAVRVDRATAEAIGARRDVAGAAADDVEREMASRSARVIHGRTAWNNLVIFDAETGQSRLLLDHRALIARIKYPRPLQAVTIPPDAMRFLPAEELIRMLQAIEGPQWPDGVMLLGIIEEDTNGDGVLGAGDAIVAYSTRVGDWQLTRLTPEGHSWEREYEDLAAQRLTLVTIHDRNKDGQFQLYAVNDEGYVPDERRYLLIDLSNPVAAAPMISEEVRQRAVQLLGVSPPTTRPAP
jgi:hypothetical protein